MTHPGRHSLNLSLASIEIDSKDALRDLAAVQGKNDWWTTSPLLQHRWSSKQPEALLHKSPIVSFEDRQGPADASEQQSTPLKYDGMSMNELHQEMDRRPVAQDVVRRILHTSKQRFDPRPISIKCGDESSLDELVAVIKGGDGREPLFAEYCKALEQKMPENSCSAIFSRKANLGGAILVGEGYRSVFKYNASQPLAKNPEVVIDTTHGVDDWKDVGYNVMPDYLVNREGDRSIDIEVGSEEEIKHQKKHPEKTWCEPVAAGEGKLNEGIEFATIGDEKHTPALQLLKYLVRSSSQLRVKVCPIGI